MAYCCIYRASINNIIVIMIPHFGKFILLQLFLPNATNENSQQQKETTSHPHRQEVIPLITYFNKNNVRFERVIENQWKSTLYTLLDCLSVL